MTKLLPIESFEKKAFLKRLWILVSVGLLSGLLGFGLAVYLRFDDGFRTGYPQGQIDLIMEMEKTFAQDLNRKKFYKNPKKYEHFYTTKDIDLYVYQGEEVKTLAIWK